MAPSFVAIWVSVTNEGGITTTASHWDLTRTILGYHTINSSSLNTIDDVIARSRDGMTIVDNLYIVLNKLSAQGPERYG
jgi:hypothetical protein